MILSRPSIVLLVAFMVMGCDPQTRPAVPIQPNATITFFGLAVDQDGNPLSGARIEYEVEAYPKDWTPNVVKEWGVDCSSVTSSSGADGKFNFTVTGCTLRRGDVVPPPGYRHFFGDDVVGRRSEMGVGTHGYTLSVEGSVLFKSDPDHPAVFVFVKDGVREVSALPCAGGYNKPGKWWIPNKPGWPKYPSLPDVDRKGAPPRVNASLPIYLRVVDQDGKPLEGVEVDVWVDRWLSVNELTVQPHRLRNEEKRRKGKSDMDGQLVVDVEAFAITGVNAEKQGYAQFKERVVNDDTPDGYSCKLIDWGKEVYRSDESLPMILVMVRDGATAVHVLPLRGGYDLVAGKWTPTQPFWPRDPSISGLTYKPPTTRP